MLTSNCYLLLASCLVLASASPIDFEDLYVPQEVQLAAYEPVLSRHARSPQHGNVDVDFKKDEFGRQGSVKLNQNLFTSNDGRSSVDAYGHAARNFDHNQNSFGGGVNARTPQVGAVDLGFKRDQFGREATAQYNRNIFTSRDGRGTIDAYASGSRNFDYNRNNFGAGVTGKWRF